MFLLCTTPARDRVTENANDPDADYREKDLTMRMRMIIIR